ncbi:HAD family hydrolase [Microbacterium sp. 179-B 1A2 NHS]|uniref:HAD family hydrolase n=1 Tax=Microbacterium sp. 179-B 1A2 NHS TaxID=3142383 RepID=UPI0039A382F2
MTSPLPAAVLWDMDGTLVDTEPYWMAAETRLVERYGGAWTHEQAIQLVGLGLEDSAVVLQAAGVEMTRPEIVAHLTDEVMRQLKEQGVPFRAGAQELLRSIRDAGIPTALVTMSMSRMAHAVVELIDFPAFDLVIGGDDVARPKPFPDPYLQACEKLGVAAGDAVALEDSPNGARAAIASGAVTIGIPNVVALDDVGAFALWPTLEGRTAADLAGVLAEARAEVRA